jgi:hypothetical protein
MTEAEPLPGMEDEVRRVLDGAAGEGITLHALGGLAIFLHAPADLPQGVRARAATLWVSRRRPVAAREDRDGGARRAPRPDR